ncbi:MAG: hypothetical protein KDK37_00800 [Leptospiraceae bacterium]|nr:hypothetical protein [Leptospiraceae bacterium]
MNGPRIVSIIFAALGLLGFLLITGFFSNTSETALVNGFFVLLMGVAGALGAMMARGVGKAVALALLFSVLCGLALTVFFQVIWPML